jgi:hypothetical protein
MYCKLPACVADHLDVDGSIASQAPPVLTILRKLPACVAVAAERLRRSRYDCDALTAQSSEQQISKQAELVRLKLRSMRVDQFA